MVEEVAAFQSLCASDGADYLSPIKCANITQAEYQLETGYPSKAIYYALESITDSDQPHLPLCVFHYWEGLYHEWRPSQG